MPVRLLIIPILHAVISEEAGQTMKMGGKNQRAVLVVSEHQSGFRWPIRSLRSPVY